MTLAAEEGRETMDAFSTLEKKVERLIDAHAELKSRVAELEAENGKLRETAAGGGQAETGRLAELEAERASLRERLERLLATIDAIEL